MADKLPAAAPPKSSARSLLAIVVLVAIAGFAGYGLFERSRLMAAQANEKKAIAFIREIKGATMESDSKDWRQLFVPDSPDMAVRVGTVTVPIMGEGPDYTKKVVEQLRTFDMCELLYLADAPMISTHSGGMGGGKPKPKEEEKDDGPKQPLEMLEVAEVRREFPKLKIVGEDTAAQSAVAKLKSKDAAASKEKEGGSEETKESSEKDASDKPADKPAESPAESPAEPAEKKDP